MNLEIRSAATSGSSVYKEDDDEEIEDAVTSKAGMPLVILSLLCQLFSRSTELLWSILL